ncbi:lamin tail domain-containing protein [Humisphaera borealis]|uniref:Lamin tail domain-containing protein n=1 Tax=Humisphaera borealis TaxID=2807512 RepID=A0A7M2WQ76_9BACT|nr:lamin tail domain-containing protein [Humisphaera borealis]QOV87553.1 lamin tail domain-containing protein [Humisphaera borealis]
MHRICRSSLLLGVGIIAVGSASSASAQVVINEFVYDDGGTDDREFVELFNRGTSALDISGWKIGGQDVVGTNTTFTIPGAIGSGTHLIPAKGFFVVGASTIPNLNLAFSQSSGTTISSFENDAETLELRNNGVLVDAVLFEANKGTATATIGFGTLPADVITAVGGGIYGNHQTNDLATAGLATSSLSRFVDGVTRSSNGRDFGLRTATPGASNTTAGITTFYNAPNVDSIANDAEVTGFAYSFSAPKAITPGTISAFNPNVIAAPPTGTKAIVAWDSTGGGNGVALSQTMKGQGGFKISAFFDTTPLPVSTNTTGTPFRGSEITQYGVMGSADALTNLTDVSGQVGVGTGLSANGATGVLWLYEKVGPAVAGGAISEKLILVDAKNGGNSNSATTSTEFPFTWTVLATVDVSGLPSGWYDLGITVNPDGSGSAVFNDQTFTFTTDANLDGTFYVGYRENTQSGSIAVPSYVRPPTWATVPEPASLSALGVLGLLLGRRTRRRARTS